MANQRLIRITKDLTLYAGEALKVEDITGTIYAFGSELATLRILKKYNGAKNVRHGYSENMKSFYISITSSVLFMQQLDVCNAPTLPKTTEQPVYLAVGERDIRMQWVTRRYLLK